MCVGVWARSRSVNLYGLDPLHEKNTINVTSGVKTTAVA